MNALRSSGVLSLQLFLSLACSKDSGALPSPEEPAQGGSGGESPIAEPETPSEVDADAWLAADCPWPAEGRAAVSLTYDDSMPSQLAQAVPALDAHGLRATFYINTVSADAPWTRLLEKGHELGAHTPTHPCPESYGVPGGALEDYSLESFSLELDQDLEQLKRLGAPEPYTFAYPCGISWVGSEHDSYVPLIQERFLAARLAGPGKTTSEVDLHLVPGQFDLKTEAALTAVVDGAVSRGEWLALGFHGVGGDWLITDAAVHEAFLESLAARKDVWVAPFGEVAACVKNAQSD